MGLKKQENESKDRSSRLDRLLAACVYVLTAATGLASAYLFWLVLS